MSVVVIAQTVSALAQSTDRGLFTQFIGNYTVVNKECNLSGASSDQSRFNDLTGVEFESFSFRKERSIMLNLELEDGRTFGINLIDLPSYGRTTTSENPNSASMIEYHPASTYGKEYVEEIKMTKDLTTPNLYVLNYFEKVVSVLSAVSINQVDCTFQLQKNP